MTETETFYVFRNATGRLLRVLSARLFDENPSLAAALAPVSRDELPRFVEPPGSETCAVFRNRAAKGEIAWIFYPARRDRVETVFSSDGTTIRVEKRVLHRARRWFDRRFRQRALSPEPLTHGEPVARAMEAAMRTGDFDRAFALLEAFFRTLTAQFPLDANACLPSTLVDAVPRNAMRDETGRLQLFDQEYERRGGVRLSFLIYRAIKMDLLFHLPKKQRRSIPFRLRYETLCRALGVPPAFCADERESKALKRFTSSSPWRIPVKLFLVLLPKRFRKRLMWWDSAVATPPNEE